MPRYDLCLAWNWEYDADFAHLVEAACAARGLSLLQVTPETLDEALIGLKNKEIAYRTFFDRALRIRPALPAAGGLGHPAQGILCQSEEVVQLVRG